MAALGRVAQQLITSRPVAALHPHAPGTAEHDPRELAVLGDLLRAQPHPFHETAAPPAVYAHKGALGHTLGSAGLVSFILAALAARTGRLPPMPWLDQGCCPTPLPLPARPMLDPAHRHAVHLVLAAGFAGHVAGASLARG